MKTSSRTCVILFFFVFIILSCSTSRTSSQTTLSSDKKQGSCNENLPNDKDTQKMPLHENITVEKKETFSHSDNQYHDTIIQMIEGLSQESFDIQKQGRALSDKEKQRVKKIQTIISLLKEMKNLLIQSSSE